MEPAFARVKSTGRPGYPRSAGLARKPSHLGSYDGVVQEAHADEGNFCRGIAIAVIFSIPIWTAFVVLALLTMVPR